MPHSILRPVAALVAATAVLLAMDAALRASTRPGRLDYTMTTLANGMQVVFLEDHSTPIVHAEIWYHVGSKNEKAGRTGFAHLFEHMMFKGSKNVEPEGHPSWISSIGGQSNAYTTEDATVFWETVPAQYLPLVLWLEADRLATLRIDEQVFKTEREVVKEERRMRIDNQPYGRLNELIYDQAFMVHPYKHPTIGSMKDLEAASIGDVRDFFRTYYVPNNATLVLVGDFNTKEAQDLATKYVGRVPKSGRPVPRDIPQEPPQTKERRVRLEESWPLPAVVVVQPGHTTEETITALIAELDQLRNEPITAAELQQAKNQFARDYIFSRESNKDKAMTLGHAAVIHNDVRTADGEFDIFMNITQADVQRVARKYFTPENRLVITIMPKAASGGATR